MTLYYVWTRTTGNTPMTLLGKFTTRRDATRAAHEPSHLDSEITTVPFTRGIRRTVGRPTMVRS